MDESQRTLSGQVSPNRLGRKHGKTSGLVKSSSKNHVIWARKNDYARWNRESYVKKGLLQVLLTGKRRFPEFVLEPWRETILGEFFNEFSKRNINGEDLMALSCSTIYGIVPQSRIFDRRIASKDTRRYKVVERGDLVYDPMLLWDASIGFLEVVEKGVVSPAYNTFKFRSESGVREYFKYLLKIHYYREHYKLISQGTNVRRRKAPAQAFLSLKVNLPANIAEQAKIASVLQACDTEIDLLTQKLAALKQQKKGLMQQLLTGKV